MIDIRDHGGSFGGGKYRKGSILNPSELGFVRYPTFTLYFRDAQTIMNAFKDGNDIYIASYDQYSTRYIYKYSLDPVTKSYVHTVSKSYSNSNIFTSVYNIIGNLLFCNNGSYRVFNKDTLNDITIVGGNLGSINHPRMYLSADGQYIYFLEISGNWVYVHKYSFNSTSITFISRTMMTHAHSGGNPMFIFYYNDIFIYQSLTNYAYATFNAKTNQGSLNSSESYSERATDDNCIILDGFLYYPSGKNIIKRNAVNGQVVSRVTIANPNDQYESLSNTIMDIDKDLFGLVITNLGSTRLVMVKKSDLSVVNDNVNGALSALTTPRYIGSERTFYAHSNNSFIAHVIRIKLGG